MPLVAQRRFTDREEPRRSFLAKLTTPQALDEYRLLTFYGVGGQGKSELFRYFQDSKTDQDDLTFSAWAKKHGPLPEYHIAPWSFHVPENRDPAEALIKLRSALAKAKIDFFHFDLAFSYYLKAASPNLDMNDEYPELFRGDYALFHDAVDIIGAFVPAVSALNILSKHALQLRPKQLRWYQEKGKALEDELKPLDQQELLDKLPIYFGRDLKAALAKSRTSRLVIMFDTYEALWEDKPQQTGLGALEVDGWIRDLVSACPGVLFVFFGRDYLKWAAFSKTRKSRNYEAMLADSQHLLGGLSETDADLFLKNAGIWQAPIRQSIIASSAGLPFYLDLQLETYNIIVEEGDEPSPDDFGGREEKVITRFLRHLNEHHESALYVLAQARQFDATVFELLKDRFLSGSPVSFTQLMKHSFIREDHQQSGQSVMHQLMCDHLLDYLKQEDPDRYELVHRALFEHYDELAKIDDITAITSLQETALVEAAYHKVQADSVGYVDWFEIRKEPFHQAARYSLLIPLCQQAIEIDKHTLGEHHPNYAADLNYFALLLDRLGNYDEAESLLRETNAIIRRALGEQHPNYAAGLNNLALLVAHAGHFEEAKSIYQQAIEISKKTIGERHPDYAARLNNFASLLRRMGRYDEAEPLFRQAIEITKQVIGEQHSGYANRLSGLALLLENTGRYNEAEPLFRQAVEIDKRTLGTLHPDYATGLINLGSILRRMGRYDEAEPLFRQAIEIAKQTTGDKHLGYAIDLNNFALLLEDMGRYDEAEMLYRQAINVCSRTVGEQHPDYAVNLNNFAYFLGARGRLDEAKPLFEAALKVLRSTLGDQHESTKSAMIEFAKLLESEN